MRIKQIAVKKLFGLFDHVIPLNMEEHITIIHGPNGFGKTILLKMLNGLFNDDDSIFYLVPFEEFQVTIENEKYIKVFPSKAKNSRVAKEVFVGFEDIEDATEINQNISIQFIETQRLLILPKRRDKSPQIIASVTKYAKDLADLIESKLADYSRLSQSLDRTFPTRLVSQTSKANPITEEELRNQLTQLEAKRSQFKAVGLLEKEEDSSFQIPQHIDEHTKKFLAIYVQDVEQKLGVFDELAEKIELFHKITKSRFLYKKLTISEDEGFFFSTHDGQRLAVTDLSSGEQHELILLYELLFKTKPDSLILIDEPELSLHIAWQSQFIKDLEAITKIGSFDILVATHSPDIISNRWDLTVELKGPELSLTV